MEPSGSQRIDVQQLFVKHVLEFTVVFKYPKYCPMRFLSCMTSGTMKWNQKRYEEELLMIAPVQCWKDRSSNSNVHGGHLGVLIQKVSVGTEFLHW